MCKKGSRVKEGRHLVYFNGVCVLLSRGRRVDARVNGKHVKCNSGNILIGFLLDSGLVRSAIFITWTVNIRLITYSKK